MTREEQKAFNAENYPASVLEWLNRETDKIFDYYEQREQELQMIIDELMFKVDSKQMDIINHFKSRTCENCKLGIKVDKAFYRECSKWKHIRKMSHGCNDWRKQDDKPN